MTVWKYELPTQDTTELMMPIGAEPLFIGVQRGVPCMWARVDETAVKEKRMFLTRVTGHPNAHGQHIGTYALDGGNFVFHVFEVRL